MKGSLQFEGVAAGSDGYSSGFGVTAEPSQQVVDLGPQHSYVRNWLPYWPGTCLRGVADFSVVAHPIHLSYLHALIRIVGRESFFNYRKGFQWFARKISELCLLAAL
jgi:hypothetical protein